MKQKGRKQAAVHPSVIIDGWCKRTTSKERQVTPWRQ
jgi:hypothetical protein